MNSNDLISPQENGIIEYEYSNKKLWNPNSFVGLSIVFSFLPAAILYSLNLGRLGLTKKRNILLISFISLFLILVSISMYADSKIMKPLFFAINIGIGAYLGRKQKETYENHIKLGGNKASYLIPMIICLVSLTFIAYLIISTKNIPESSLKINDDELYYTKNVQIEEVNKLGNYLTEGGMFVKDENKISVKIDKRNNTYIFSFPIEKEFLNDNQNNLLFKTIGEGISKDVFNNSPVEVHLCDNRLNTLKIISIY